jgi:tyrocidine synthetase III
MRRKKKNLVQMTDLKNLPLSSNQKRLWAIYQQDKVNPAYNLALTYHLKGGIDIEILKKSIGSLFNRHYTMFSVFKQQDGNPYIEINRRPVDLELVDFSGHPDHSRRESILSFAGEDSRKWFDIENGPLYRLYLLKENDSSYFFHATIHHLIFDGWSRRIFVQDLSTTYSSFISSLNDKLEPIRLQSFDFVSINAVKKSEMDEDELKKFWIKNLSDCPSKLNFTCDRPRKNYPSGLGNRESIVVSRDCSRKLKELSARSGTSLFTIMVSALGILFQKFTGEDDICFGVPVSNRRFNNHLDKIFGLFVDSTVVRMKIDDNNNFLKHLLYSSDVVRSAIKHSDLSFEKIVSAVNPERVVGVNPLFQVSLSWMTGMTIPMDLGGIVGEKVLTSIGVSPFDLAFYIWENEEYIEGEIEYNIDILDRETIIRLKNNFLTLLSNLVENPEMAIKSLQVLNKAEKENVLSFKGIQTNYPKDKTIVQLFEEQVSFFPDKTALVFKDNALTYNQLNEKINQLARTLRKQGVGRNTPVGILSEKSLDMIIGILGILKSGGVYIPVDPDYPKQRLDFIIKDVDFKFLLTQEKYMELSFENIVKLNLNSSEIFKNDNSNVENLNSSSDLAYIMYTSGSTGNPKGSMINQYSIVRLVRNTNYIDMSQDDRILLTSAIVFDVATFEIWGALLNGGTLYIAEKETILNPKALGEELVKNDITILWLTSALFTHIAEEKADIFEKLKYLLVGGDILSALHINKVRKANPGLKVINGYGPTENTTFSTTYLIKKDYNYNIPIGKPISNSTAYIFDKNMNYQPIGVIGELYVGGDGVSIGYINRDDLNSQSFIDHPHLPGERLYRTGDYARWLPDGNIEFHGRIDNQIKIRGFRVELEEVESVISEIDGVIETIIKPIRVEDDDVRLVAFLHVSETFKMKSKDIGRLIEEKLPVYMIPSAYQFLHEFPHTINGKIDRKALNFDFNEMNREQSEETGILTPTEKIIRKIWSNVLKTKEISLKDNFFDIGGNSLLAITVFSKIESTFNIELGLRVFFDSPRIKDLAEFIDISIQNLEEKKNVEKNLKNDIKIVNGEI